MDQLWVVESAESIFECHRDVPVRLGARKTWFSLKKGVYFFLEGIFCGLKSTPIFNDNHVFLASRCIGTSRSPSKMFSVDSTTQNWVYLLWPTNSSFVIFNRRNLLNFGKPDVVGGFSTDVYDFEVAECLSPQSDERFSVFCNIVLDRFRTSQGSLIMKVMRIQIASSKISKSWY